MPGPSAVAVPAVIPNFQMVARRRKYVRNHCGNRPTGRPHPKAASGASDVSERSIRVTDFGRFTGLPWPHADLSHCSAHGLRKLAAPRLANAGCSEREIMAITGHRSLSEVSRYTKAADQARLSEQAMSKMMKAEHEQQLSDLPTRLDKTSPK